MYLVLYAVGLLVTAAGFVTIGFGIPINAFSLGNTLIIAGTTAVAGGLILIALAAAVRQLNRIREALHAYPAGRPAAAPAPVVEPAEPHALPVRIPPTAGRTPAPPKPVEVATPRSPEPRPAAEPRFSPPSETAAPLDWLRPKSTASSEPPAAEPPMMEVPDEAPLSPRAPQRPANMPPPRTPSRAEPAPLRPEPARMTPMAERSRDINKEAGKDGGLFDVVWPDARSKPVTPEPPKHEPQVVPPARPRGEKRAEHPSERPVAILKSGVIDGMAYTLYADGSIEAELPQGTVRFASVDALREHLEKSA
jgi:hypothetical protein